MGNVAEDDVDETIQGSSDADQSESTASDTADASDDQSSSDADGADSSDDSASADGESATDAG